MTASTAQIVQSALLTLQGLHMLTIMVPQYCVPICIQLEAKVRSGPPDLCSWKRVEDLSHTDLCIRAVQTIKASALPQCPFIWKPASLLNGPEPHHSQAPTCCKHIVLAVKPADDSAQHGHLSWPRWELVSAFTGYQLTGGLPAGSAFPVTYGPIYRGIAAVGVSGEQTDTKRLAIQGVSILAPYC